MPSRRNHLLTRWAFLCRDVALGPARWIAGARFNIRGGIPFRPGVLLLMNHQSIFDIPIVATIVDSSYPYVIARERYTRGIPVVSHMLRFYGHPTVKTGNRDRGQLKEIRRRAMTADRPFGVYPEGTRSRDGELQPFRTSGLRVILPCRHWEVYIVVVDGLWKVGRFAEVVENIGRVDAEADWIGPFEFVPGRDDVKEFISEMEKRMGEKLTDMRRAKKRDGCVKDSVA